MRSNMEKVPEVILLWLSFAAALTVFSGLVYLAVQQDMRQGGNNPQIQMAEDAATALVNGKYPNEIIPASSTITIGESLAPYIVIFDDTGKPIAGSGRLHGALPALPPGVFGFTKVYGEDRFTWQPEPYVRQAVVVVHYSGAQSGFVLAGRSLREIEIREANLEIEVGAAWLFGLFVTLITTAIFVYREELTGRISGSK